MPLYENIPIMPKISITRPDGVTIEAELSFDEFKEVAGINGHKTASPNLSAPAARRGRPPAAEKLADIAGFITSLNDRAKKFISVLKHNPKGIEARPLAQELGFAGPSQLGGLTGPLSRVASRHGINVRALYKSVLMTPNNDKKRMFYPGKLTLELRMEE